MYFIYLLFCSFHPYSLSLGLVWISLALNSTSKVFHFPSVQLSSSEEPTVLRTLTETKVSLFLFKLPKKQNKTGGEKIIKGNNCKSSQSAKFQLTAFVTSSVLNAATSVPSRCLSAFLCFLSSDCRGKSTSHSKQSPKQNNTSHRNQTARQSPGTDVCDAHRGRDQLRPHKTKKTKTWTTCGIQSTQFVHGAIRVASSWAETPAGGCNQDDGGGSSGGSNNSSGGGGGGEDSNVNMDVANETPN